MKQLLTVREMKRLGRTNGEMFLAYRARFTRWIICGLCLPLCCGTLLMVGPCVQSVMDVPVISLVEERALAYVMALPFKTLEDPDWPDESDPWQ